MTDKEKGQKFDRRDFLKTAVAGTGAAALGGVPSETVAQTPSAFAASVAAPTAAQLSRDAGLVAPPLPANRLVVRPGSDLMVDVLRQLGIEFVASNPGSSFEGIQESIANYGNPANRMPEFITALHEETSVDMANGYGKAEGKPMCALLHGTIGIQHASMSIYQAYHSGTPMLLIAGRDDGFIQAHTANDMAAICRSFTKWDAQPKTLEDALHAIQEAYRQAITPPTGPTLVVIDMELQKEEAGDMQIPSYVPPTIRGVAANTARDIARQLLAANNPRINVGNLRTPAGVTGAIELAELVGACTSTSAMSASMSFPQRHPLCGPGADTNYDFVLGLDADSPNISIKRPTVASLTSTRDVMGVGFGGLRANATASAAPASEAVVFDEDAEASIPLLVNEVAGLVTAAQKTLIEQRKAQHAVANQEAYMADLRAALDLKRKGWNQSPVSTARLYAELWPLIMDEDWCLASPSGFSGSHHRELWVHNKPYSFLGGQGAAGMGYGIGASAGAALAARERKRIVVNIQCDGDLNYAPGALWSAAHHQLPMLTIMHNNRAYHQELMFVEYLAGVRGRGTDRGHIGTTLRQPFISYAKMAEAYGVASEGPIDDPAQLADAFKRGVAAVKNGQPYLIDVLTQPR